MADEGRTITVEIDGEEKEIQLPEGLVSEDDLRDNYLPKSMFRAELAKQTREAKKGLVSPDDLLGDDEFLDRIAEARKDDLMERLGVKPNAEPDEQSTEKLLKRWREKEVAPLEGRLSEFEEEVSTLRRHQLAADTRKAFAEVGVDDEGGNDELIELWIERRATYDTDARQWVVNGDDGEPDFVVEDGKPRPKRVADLLREVKASGTKPGWFKGETRPGVGVKDTDGRGVKVTKNVKEMSEAEKSAYIEDNGLDAWKKKLVEDRRKK